MVYRQKFQYVSDVPHLFVASVGHHLGNVSIDVAKAKVKLALQICARAVEDGRRDALDSISIRYGIRGTPEFASMESFVSTDLDLALPIRVRMRNYALGKIHCRLTEGQHAIIQHLKRHKRKLNPSLANQRLKRLDIESALLKDPDFKNYCVATFNRRCVKRKLLQCTTPNSRLGDEYFVGRAMCVQDLHIPSRRTIPRHLRRSACISSSETNGWSTSSRTASRIDEFPTSCIRVFQRSVFTCVAWCVEFAF